MPERKQWEIGSTAIRFRHKVEGAAKSRLYRLPKGWVFTVVPDAEWPETNPLPHDVLRREVKQSLYEALTGDVEIPPKPKKKATSKKSTKKTAAKKSTSRKTVKENGH